MPLPTIYALGALSGSESSSSEYEDYAKRAASPYLCLLCPVGFVHNPPLLNKPNLMRHLGNVHRNHVIPEVYLSGLKVFRCEACAGVFSRSGLRSHRCMPELKLIINLSANRAEESSWVPLLGWTATRRNHPSRVALVLCRRLCNLRWMGRCPAPYVTTALLTALRGSTIFGGCMVACPWLQIL